MTQTGSAGFEQPRSPAARRFGYLVAIGVNLVLLYVVNNLLEWGVPEFLTDDFERVLPIEDFLVFNFHRDYDIARDGRFLMVFPADSDGDDATSRLRVVILQDFFSELTQRAPVEPN